MKSDTYFHDVLTIFIVLYTGQSKISINLTLTLKCVSQCLSDFTGFTVIKYYKIFQEMEGLERGGRRKGGKGRRVLPSSCPAWGPRGRCCPWGRCLRCCPGVSSGPDPCQRWWHRKAAVVCQMETGTA